MLVLGIETSCDETGVALYDTERGLLGHALHSQVALHADYGGVVPELASRDHIRRLLPLTRGAARTRPAAALDDADRRRLHRRARASPARCWSAQPSPTAWPTRSACPRIGVHHLEAHLLSPLLSRPAPEFPFVALLVSGGHTQLMRVAGVGDYELLGETLDDAAGEAFDKSAKLLGWAIPGGPALAQLATRGQPGRYPAAAPDAHERRSRFQLQRAEDRGADLATRERALTEAAARRPGRRNRGGDRRSARRQGARRARAHRTHATRGRRRRRRQPRRCARGSTAKRAAARHRGVLPGARVLHRQRRDDRVRRRDAPASAIRHSSTRHSSHSASPSGRAGIWSDDESVSACPES